MPQVNEMSWTFSSSSFFIIFFFYFISLNFYLLKKFSDSFFKYPSFMFFM